ncbi:ribosome maturation factor RimM [Synechococcus sp. RSCCF101]|uniref:ribosome maturation factor RimM n=1 Tax=Synechococcus sp. RSCCF101 TaxID=2511069 RepID=UPI00124424FE|nr:ribosome maturation factor RimM [Synechococcus sp. RSCCF101]QEY32468.1 ribosome maturation factor RimM [Synechococcus sp. RSCCF101]
MEALSAPQGDPDEESWLVVGRIVAAHGLRGELRVNPSSDFPERFTRPGPRWLRTGRQPAEAVTLTAGRPLPGKRLFVVRLEGIRDRTGAESLVGRELLVPADQRPELAEGEFHRLDLLNLEVRLLPDGTAIGRVSDLLGSGQSLLEVALEREGTSRRVLVPFVDAIVPEVRPDEGWIGIDPPPGLLEL